MGFFGGFFILNFSHYFINLNNDKNKFITHDSYLKNALKYSRSSLGNQQDKVISNEKSQKKTFQMGF